MSCAPLSLRMAIKLSPLLPPTKCLLQTYRRMCVWRAECFLRAQFGTLRSVDKTMCSHVNSVRQVTMFPQHFRVRFKQRVLGRCTFCSTGNNDVLFSGKLSELFARLQTLSSIGCCKYSSQKEAGEEHKVMKKREVIHEVIQEKKERIKESGQLLLKDIRETRDKVKERMEEVVETENVWTIPNLLCVMRIVVSPLLGYLILQSNYTLALGLLGVAGISDVLDGWIARTFESQASKMGSFLDPMADKVLIAVLFLSLTYMDLIPVILTGAIIARDLLLVGAGFVIRYRSIPPPRTLSRYFDVTYATAQLAPTAISKVNTAIQLLLVASTLAAPVFGYVDHQALHVLWYVTACTTVSSAFSYLVSKNTYKYFKPRQ
ncbi:probable cardiolipin synthase (CMP-forming) [Bacillus rossius redtenbacheri]|uniref:probable cardiolipin synthase (CMP-forming) n=1 Tax=Bacillus rossius redtenbacheri TaxID=93214 RepID=UPI002FDE2668